MITIIHAHPYIHHSKIGRSLLNTVLNLPHLEVRELYELYPDFHIDIKKEQQQLLKTDVIVLQNPMHWYHVPSLMSLWFEKVLAYGWAHGNGQQALAGKKLLWSVTSADEAHSFDSKGYNHFTLEEMARPLQQMALFCGMKWLDPFAVFNANRLSENEIFQVSEKYRDRLVLEMTSFDQK